MDNQRREVSGWIAVNAHEIERNQRQDTIVFNDENIIDCIADVLHYADGVGLDIKQLSRIALDHVAHERRLKI